MYRFFDLSTWLFSLVRKLLFVWVRLEVKGLEQEHLNLDPDKPVCYVLQHSSLSSRLVLEECCLRYRLPSAQAKLKLGDDTIRRSFFFLYERQGHWFRRRQMPTVTSRLKQMARDVDQNESLDVQIVPVSLFWGRGPEKEGSLLKLLTMEGWTVAGPFQKLLTILIHGRNTFVQFNAPISMRELYQETQQDHKRTARKTARLLRMHFRRVRNSVLGPNLSHRQTLVESVTRSPSVQEAIAAYVQEHETSEAKARQQALKYGNEIAANLQMSTIHFLDRLLNKLWNKLYNGISVNNIEAVREVAKDHAVVYVPCHRSHIDYLVLSYVLFNEGIMVPHIAAGINLNLPVVGKILRRGGAFFMRRSFKGNALYSAIFSEYIHTIFKRGYSVEYFVEGGRSRTGRTLRPKAGMLAMTVNSYLRDQTKPIAFVPIYFGYEKIFEGRSYLGELRGAEKKKESVFGLFKSLGNLKSSYGRVNVNFGDPIVLSEFLDAQAPGWLEQLDHEDEKPEWLFTVIEQLSYSVVTGINSAAAMNPISACATVLLSSPNQAMDADALIDTMKSFDEMLRRSPYSERMTLPAQDSVDWLSYAEKMKFVERRKHSMGDIIYLNERNAVALTYNRNNVLHFFALPSLIACIVQQHSRIELSRVRSIFKLIYPYIRSELFLRWSPKHVNEIFDQWIANLSEQGLIKVDGEFVVRPSVGSRPFVQLATMSRLIIQTLERYYIVIAALMNTGSDQINPDQLESRCTQMAERISILFGLNAPEFFDKTLFRNFIDQLRQHNIIDYDQDQPIRFKVDLESMAEDARLLLNSELRQAIIQVTSEPVEQDSVKTS